MAETPASAAGFLKELSAIIQSQQALLELQKRRIAVLEQRVSELCVENSRLRHEQHTHLLTCRLQAEYGSTRIVRRHACLPVEVPEGPSSRRSAVCRRAEPRRQWTTLGYGLNSLIYTPQNNSIL
ncbi:hypothetical protein R3I93_018363 [Phoxinus phoxinus]|uniref:IQ motif and SEC7 domain-containing protein 2 n=1 Tax=Phoxinus phoxinus TaxID=58324 RepID=A0AAN9GUN0_9TELE